MRNIVEYNLQKHMFKRLFESIMQDIRDAPKELQHQCDIPSGLFFL